MKLLKIFLFIFSLTLSLNSVSQTNESINNLDSLIIILKRNPDVKDTKLFTKHYNDGSIKLQYLGVSYKSDSINRYWETGQGRRYFKNGQLAGKATYDTKTHVICDTSKIYLENGKLQRIMIWNSNYSKTIFMQTSTTCKYYPDSYKVIWFYNDSSIFKE